MNYIDTETFSPTPIKWGTYRYLDDAEVMIVTYALGDDAPVQVWDVTDGSPMPADLRYVVDDPEELFTAHSSMFDRNSLPKVGIIIPIPRWRDTLVKALCHGLPGGLDALCTILRIDADKAKVKDGKRLIQLFCKPRPANQKIRRATRETHPEDWQRFIDYAKGDVTAMREVDHKLPEWNYSGSELAAWHRDQRINDRGMCVDTTFATAAIAAVEREQARLGKKTLALTHGEVASTTQRDQLLAHIIKGYGIELPNMQMATLERRIADPDLPVELRELLSVRLAASSTSTSKFAALLRGVQGDGRLRGTLQFAGAARTRRWAGRTFQPQNLPRIDAVEIARWHGIEILRSKYAGLESAPGVEEHHIVEYLDTAIESTLAGVADIMFDDVMAATRMTVRGAIVAPPEKKLVIADLANIEGRDAAWLAGEDWKLQAFRDYDAGTGPDLYKLAYAKAFQIEPSDVAKQQRQIGKVMELMLQYEGGVGAFITGAATYGIDLKAMTEVAYPTLPGDVVYEAEGFLEWVKKEKRDQYGLDDQVFVTCDSLKRLWRRAHPAIHSLWADLKGCAINAINNPGNTVECRMFKLRRDGAWLRIRLPSGAYLCYPSPRVHEDNSISYMGMNQYTRQWSRLYTYGGKLFENACQAVAGDVLKASMPEMEDAGYEIVLTVHDEAVTETPDTEGYSAEALSAIMSREREWTKGMPLAAAGFETQRYRKE